MDREHVGTSEKGEERERLLAGRMCPRVFCKCLWGLRSGRAMARSALRMMVAFIVVILGLSRGASRA